MKNPIEKFYILMFVLLKQEVEAHSKKLEEITKSLEKLATNEKFEQLKLQQDEHRNFVYHKIAKVDLQVKNDAVDCR
jgi:hypothetical protein